MKIPSARTLRDMELAAELRAAGATWETIGAKLSRQPNVVQRWACVYRDEWERMLAEAEERLSRLADGESRTALRQLVRHKSAKLRLAAADKISRRRMEELKRRGPGGHDAGLAAMLGRIEEMSDDELESTIADFVRKVHGEPDDAAAAAGVESAAGAAGPG